MVPAAFSPNPNFKYFSLQIDVASNGYIVCVGRADWKKNKRLEKTFVYSTQEQMFNEVIELFAEMQKNQLVEGGSNE